LAVVSDHGISRALAFDRQIRVSAAERSTVIPGGVVVRHDGLQRKWILNAVMLDAPLSLDAAGVVALADDHLAGLAHRYVVIDDAGAGARVGAELAPAGWNAELVLFLRWPPGAPAPRAEQAAVRLDAETLRSTQLAFAIEERGGGALAESLSRSLVAGEEALRASTPWAAFGAGPNGRIASTCTLFIAGGCGNVAMLDEVGTLLADRGRGYSRAAVCGAIAEAVRLGCDPIVIGALADDWPLAWYERLGFEPIGAQASLSLAAVRPGP
jgi:hypothetical protein